MPGCDACQALLLDHLYGLLDPTEAAAVDAHIANCPTCTIALADSKKSQALFAVAAKGQFPSVTFAAPDQFPTKPDKSSEPADERASVNRFLTRWAVAAGLLLSVCGLAIPTAFDVAEFFDGRPAVVQSADRMAEARGRFDAAAKAEAAARLSADEKLAATRLEHDRLVAAWVADEKAAIEAAANRPFAIEVHGPAAAVPGAPNEYTVAVKDRNGKPKAAKVTAKVSVGDAELLSIPATDGVVRLPANLWEKVPAGGDAFLQVSATADGLTAKLREPVRLLGPVFATFLTTDKPLYKPGETVYFRSTTLDRTRLLPPENDTRLRFELAGPDGKVIDSLTAQARAATAVVRAAVDVLGPDGRPVRGVGCGGFDLKPDVPGGTYTLSVFELAPGQNSPTNGTAPLAQRVFQVAGYRPDRLEKKLEFDGSSYGPGEPVQARLTVADQGKPVAGVKLTAIAKVDDKTLPVIGDTLTAADGSAALRFSLPGGVESGVATLSVTVTKEGVTETIIRPVPLANRKLTIEFFPEGGELVAGLSNRVYFRAFTANGRPADISGVLTDGERDLTTVHTLRDGNRPGVNRGLGLFTVTPEAGKTYTIKLSQPVNAELPPGGFKLPVVKPGGVVMFARDPATTAGKGPIRLTLGYAGKQSQRVLVGAYARGRAIAHAHVELHPGKTTDLALDPGLSPLGGVVRVTVFADDIGADGRTDLTPLAERLVFRRPAESLKLTVSAGKASFVPGEPVSLTVTARTEAGQATPAIVWASVVSRSVLSMADDKAERTLPTHFLLGGEVQHPDELEHADFLLTDQPHAAESLDLVLGTQGWRRFAEQAPEEFRARVPAAQAERLLASLGASSPQFVRTEVQAVSDRYWPKYEAVALSLEMAEKGLTDKNLTDATTNRMIAASQYESARSSLGAALDQFDPIDERLLARRWWLAITLSAMLATVLCLLIRRRRRTDTTERRWLSAGLVGVVLVGLIVLIGSAVTADVGSKWRREALSASRSDKYAWGQVAVTATAPPDTPIVAMNGNTPFAQMKPLPAGPVTPPTAQGLVRSPKTDAPPPPARHVVDSGQPTVKRPNVLQAVSPTPSLPPGNRVADNRLQQALNEQMSPADEAAIGQIRSSVPRGRPFLVREYANTALRPPGAPRTDFTETVLWKPLVVLPDTGIASFEFNLSDSVTGYRVLVAGHTLDGRLGAVTETISVQPPLSVEPKLPREVSTSDILAVPVVVANGTGMKQEAQAAVTVADRTIGGGTLSLDQHATGRLMVRLPTLPAGSVSIAATVSAEDVTDSIRRNMVVVPDGFPIEGAKSARLTGKLSATVNLPGDRAAGGTRVGVTVYPNALAGLLGGLDGMLKEPHGCFEQSSSANYPNVLALDYLRTTTTVAPAAASQSRQLLDSGYGKLTAYECADTPARTKKGFEWFGAADRPHPALSAYGLLQFTDMSRVYPVDPAMIARTKSYLLSLRTGDGGFKHSTAKLDQFGRAPDHITDAYVVWAVSEAERSGKRSDLTKELDALLDRAARESASDPYFLALVANAALNRDRTNEGLKLLDAILAKQAATGGVPGASTTITSSRGDDIVVETTALVLLGWLKADRPERFATGIGKAVDFLVGRRKAGGAFGATQATVLALKALVEHARRNQAEPEGGELRLLVNGTLVAKQAIRTDATGPLTLLVPDAEELFPPGKPVELTAETNLKQPVPVSLTWATRTTQPPTAANPPITLATGFDLSVLSEGQTTRLTATVTNATAETTGMTVAILGLPAGLTVPADGKQLRQLTQDGCIDFWEVRGRELVLYWRGLGPNEAKIVPVELVAEFPGEFRGPASRAYLYYNADQKHWVAPLKAVIKPAP